jgi:autoinducer 2-degrading protein
MHITHVHVHVKSEHLDAFVAATRLNHEGSVREPGNLRFDVLQSEDDPTHFVLVEVYRDADAAAAHKQTPHYLAWRDAVADWMAAPREARRYWAVAPESPDHW